MTDAYTEKLRRFEGDTLHHGIGIGADHVVGLR